MRQLRHGVSPGGTALTDRAATGFLDLEPIAGAAPAALDIARIVLPPRLRPAASVGVLDITEFFGDTTGGVRTYLLEKAQYVQRHADPAPGAGGARRAGRDPGGRRGALLPAAWTVHPHPETLSLHARDPLHQPDRGPRTARSDRGRQRLVRALAGAPRDPAAPGAGGLVLPQQLPPGHHAAAARRRVGPPHRYRSGLALRPPPGSHGRGDHRALPGAGGRAERGRAAERHPRPARREPGAVHARPPRPTPRIPGTASACGDARLRCTWAGWRWRRISTSCWTPGPRWSAAPASAWCSSGWAPPAGGSCGAAVGNARLAVLRGATGTVWPTSTPPPSWWSRRVPSRPSVWPRSKSLSSGVPVLAADHGGVAETVERSGGGRHFARGIAPAWPRRPSRCSRAIWPTFGARGRQYAAAHHGWDGVFDRLFEVYRRVLRR